MGFVRKTSGVQAQIDAQNKNADAQEKATKQAAADQQTALMSQAKATAEQQTMLSERAKAEEMASEIASAPRGTADVALSAPADEPVAVTRRNRRASFGQGYSTGVSI